MSWARAVDRDKHGNVVLKGTDVEVYRIAALIAAGVSVGSVLEDYPSLTADQIVFSQVYATAHPIRGRLYPPMTAKAAMRLADLSALDLDD